MIVREPVVREPARSAVQRLGRRVFAILAEVGRAAMICVGAVAAMRFALTKRARADIVDDNHFAGTGLVRICTDETDKASMLILK